MSINDASIHRIYNCDNKECNAQISYHEKVKDPWRKKCPFCKKKSLYLFKAVTNISTFIDTKSPKTMGMISDQNRKRREAEQGPEKKKRPFWRTKNKVDFNILKNPTKYIQTGTV